MNYVTKTNKNCTTNCGTNRLCTTCTTNVVHVWYKKEYTSSWCLFLPNYAHDIGLHALNTENIVWEDDLTDLLV